MIKEYETLYEFRGDQCALFAKFSYFRLKISKHGVFFKIQHPAFALVFLLQLLKCECVEGSDYNLIKTKVRVFLGQRFDIIL